MHGGKLRRVVAQSENFVETCESQHLKEAIKLSEIIPRSGV